MSFKLYNIDFDKRLIPQEVIGLVRANRLEQIISITAINQFTEQDYLDLFVALKNNTTVRFFQIQVNRDSRQRSGGYPIINLDQKTLRQLSILN